MFSLICAWTNGWASSRDAGDFRRHRAHYDVTLMIGVSDGDHNEWLFSIIVLQICCNLFKNSHALVVIRKIFSSYALLWPHNGRDGVSNHQPHDCLLNRLFRRRSKKTSKLRVTGLCAGNSPVTGQFPAQRVSNAEKKFPFDDVIMVVNHCLDHNLKFRSIPPLSSPSLIDRRGGY